MLSAMMIFSLVACGESNNKKVDILLGENESLLTEENYKIYYKTIYHI